MARKAEAHREELRAEARQRQNLLVEAIAGEESRRASLEEITRENRIDFVLHREDLSGTLEDIAGDRLVNIVPGKGGYGGGRGIEGIKGSWLAFEKEGSKASSKTASRGDDPAYTGRA